MEESKKYIVLLGVKLEKEFLKKAFNIGLVTGTIIGISYYLTQK